MYQTHVPRIGPIQGIYEESSTAKHLIGERLVLNDGRTFHYCKATAVALAAGKLIESVGTSFTEDTVTVAHAIGTTAVTVTASAAITANRLAGGYLVVNAGTGAGNCYKIKDHLAIANAATGTINLYDPLVVAWAVADTDIMMHVHPCAEVRISTTDQLYVPIGTPLIAVTASYYFWAQTWGWAPMLMDEAIGDAAAKRALNAGTSVAGAIEAEDGAAGGECEVAWAVNAGASTDAEYELVYLRCLP